MNKFGLFTTLLLAFSLNSFAKVSVGKLDFSKEKSQGKLVINYDGNFTEYPELSVTGNSILVDIPNATVGKKQDRRVNFSNNNRDTRIRSYQYDKKQARVKATFPFNIKNLEHKVSLTIKDNKIELSFPRVAVSPKKFQAKQALKDSGKRKKVSKSFTDDVLNESYLASLEKEQTRLKKSKARTTFLDKKPVKKSSDAVKTALAATKKAPAKKGKSSFSLMEYGGKFIAFLGVVLLLFYGVVSLMRKGVIKKGRLGFLNNTDQVQVLSQTYIAPKKSLMLIKAHNQVFLVSNTDAGIHPISEINDPTGLMKDGEKIIAGDNFDDNLLTADTDETVVERVRLKEDIAQLNKKSAMSSYSEVKDKVKFSDQLKKKVKNLKPLQ
jgi:flagellar biogenesis protein FliO